MAIRVPSGDDENYPRHRVIQLLSDGHRPPPLPWEAAVTAFVGVESEPLPCPLITEHSYAPGSVASLLFLLTSATC